MKKHKVIRNIIALIILVAVLLIPNVLAKANKAGTIDVVVEDVDRNIITEKTIDFKKDEKCTNVICKNLKNVLIENGMPMNIESLKTPADWSRFICIYLNDEISQVGIESIVLQDGMKISFVMTVYEY